MKQTSLYDSLLKKKKKNMTIDSDDEQEIAKMGENITQLKITQSANKITEPPSHKKITPPPAKKLLPQQSSKQDDFLSQFTDATPKWALHENCLDAEKRRRDHPQYDPTTLYVPQEAWAKFTAPMKQFWRIKSVNFDKIILFKLGKFYELFYDDAMIGNKYLELKYMGTKMHTGFPQKSLERYTNQLVKLGFKTVIVEQMETPDQMNERVRKDKEKGRKSEKTISRQVTQILTKGTVPKSDQEDYYLPNYLLSIYVHNGVYGFSLLEISSNEILMGVVDDFDKFKTVLYQTRPVEVIYDPDNIPFDIIQMMRDSFLQMQLSQIKNKNNIWHPLNATCELDNLDKSQVLKKPKIFQAIETNFSDKSKDLLYGTLSGMFHYLKNVFRFEYVMGAVRFTFYEKEKACKNMVLDSQALQHLQIFETTQGEAGSLFRIIDRTKTKFGRRLLRRWLTSPLMNSFHIEQRLNAVEDLQKFVLEKKNISASLKKLPDLQKMINKLYHYAVKTTTASKAIYFQDVNTARLKQYRSLLEHINNAWDSIRQLSRHCSSFTSSRLKQLLTLTDTVTNEDDPYYEDEDDQSCYTGLLPNVIQHLNEFDGYIQWQDNKPVPQKGLVQFFDELQDESGNIKQELEQYLEEVRKGMKEPNLKFAHTKERYQIEIPQKSQKKRPEQFEFSSKKAGYSRYISPITKKMVKRLEKVQQSIKEQMGLFIGFFFQQFKKKQKIWQRFIQILSQLDCLISLSDYSFYGTKVRPLFEEGKFQIRDAKHPCLLNIEFIPNDILMEKKVILLTGPNMGGKSTILRTTCLLAVLAQIGCYVPASYYNCQTIDRIFTRIGASDRLQLGKSTFFIEMEETRSVLRYGSKKSLAIIDQLGRGTSTFDGMAIAYSVLNNIIEDIGCYCLFATHYHSLVDEFAEKEDICLKKMDCQVKGDKIIFLYQLVDGHVSRSFGLNVARSVGINNEIIQMAQEKAEEMHEEIEKKRQGALNKMFKFLKQ